MSLYFYKAIIFQDKDKEPNTRFYLISLKK